MGEGTGRRAGYTGFWCEWTDRAAHRRRRRFPTLDRARRARKLIEDHLNSWVSQPEGALWADIRTLYESTLTSKSESHRAQVKRTLAGLGDLRTVSEFNTDRVIRFVEAIDRPQKRAKTIRHLSAIANWLIKRGYMQASPVKAIERPTVMKRTVRAPSPDDVSALLAHCDNQAIPLFDRQAWYLLILLAYITGYRQQTLLKLRLANIDVSGPGGTAIVTAVESKTKQEERRVLPKTVCDLVARRMLDLPDGSVTFFGWDFWQRHAWDRHRRFQFRFRRDKQGRRRRHQFPSHVRVPRYAAAIDRIRAQVAEVLEPLPRVYPPGVHPLAEYLRRLDRVPRFVGRFELVRPADEYRLDLRPRDVALSNAVLNHVRQRPAAHLARPVREHFRRAARTADHIRDDREQAAVLVRKLARQQRLVALGSEPGESAVVDRERLAAVAESRERRNQLPNLQPEFGCGFVQVVACVQER